MTNYLIHYGVKGMHWGVRRYQNYDGTIITRGQKKQIKAAKKDAKEYARAKMYYGEGAGNRRKLINATVNQRSKDPTYKKAFEEALSNQDMADHAAKARGERKRKDVKDTTVKTGRGVANTLRGRSYAASTAGLAIGTGIMFAHKSGMDKVLLSKIMK